MKFIENLVADLSQQAEREVKKLEAGYELLLNQYGLTKQPYEPDELYSEASKLKPKRLFKGPLNNILARIREELGEERADWYEKYIQGPWRRLGSNSFEIVNFMDGERSLLDIRRIVSFEFKETNMEFVLHFVEDLKDFGLVAFN